MRRILASVTLLPMLVLLIAAPVAAAPPTKTTGTQAFMSAFSTTCGPSTCTDTFVDVFTVDEGLIVVCVGEVTFNIHNGRTISDDNGCSEASSDALVISDDLSSASLSPTDVTFFDCGPQTCTEGDTVSVSAELTGFGPVFSDTQRSTFDDGTCVFKFTSSGDQRQASGTITIDGETLAADGGIGMGKFTETARCR